MKIEVDLAEAMWETDWQVILRSNPLEPEKMAVHVFKLGMQAYRKEIAGGVPQDEIATKAHTVSLISKMTQRLIDHYRKHNKLSEDLRGKVKDPAAAVQAVKDALTVVEETKGGETVKLFKQEIFMAGIASIFPEIDEILGGPKVEVPKAAPARPKSRKRKGGKR